MRTTILIIITVTVLFSNAFAQEENTNFDFVIGLTQQNADMDWWFAVPSEFAPKISTIHHVVKKEYFKIIPIFNNYSTDANRVAKITYDATILKPDSNIYQQMKELNGCSHKILGPYVIPAKEMLAVCFEPEDPFGEYTINIIAVDHVKNEKAEKSAKISLKEFVSPELKKDEAGEWILAYPMRPEPEKAIAAFLMIPRPYIDEKGDILWSTIWFFKYVFEENNFLIPHAIKFFDEKATEQQKKDMMLLFYLLKKTEELTLTEDLKKYSKELNKIKIPDPYSEIKDGAQLDMLWAEFFATARIKPIRQIISSFKLSKFAGTLEKVKAKELDANSEAVRQQAMSEAVFRAAIWSLSSNCEQSDLVFQYCVGLYQSQELNDMEKGCLGSILKK